MKRASNTWLVCRALLELALYDVTHAVTGFQGVMRRLPSAPVARAMNTALERDICAAVGLAACFYWRPVLCLQRSCCTVRLLRRHGLSAQLIIGYRPAPFFSHAWVEADGRMINDSPAYRQQLRVLYTA